MRGSIIGLVLASATLGAACSFITSFPDIEVVGGGDLGGGGGQGGAPACVAAACQTCLTPAATCPIAGDAVELVAPSSAPGVSAATSVEVIDIVQKSGGARYFGNFLDTGSMGLEATDGSLRGGDQQIGFILGPNGERIVGAGSCNNDMTPSGATVVFSSGTVADDKLVVSGVFIGDRLVVFPSELDCAMNPTISSPAVPDDFVPFLIWFRSENDQVELSLGPTDAGQLLDNGYISDVAALPGGGVTGRIAAIGYATRDPFGEGVDFGAIPRYYVLVSGGPDPTAELTLDKSSCGNFSDLDALRSSIAVDSEGRIWVAGTGCPLGQQGDDESFLTRLDGADLDGATTLTIAAAGSPIGVTEVAVSDAIVVVAGTYAGSPVESLANGDAIPTGEPGDGFVMAFAREGWGNQSKPIWFQRIASAGADARVETLAVDGGRVFVGGRMGASGGIGERQGCWASTAPGRGRAFFAQLSEAGGDLDWLHVEGFEAAETTDIEQLFARGMALSPVAGGGLLTATGFHGELLLECGPDATNATANPEVWLRLFDLQ